MQSISTPDPDRVQRESRLLVVELWGLGDLALAVPFLRAASQHMRVTLLAKPHAAPLVRRFCPEVELIPFTAPWTAFRGKYRLLRWPWLEISALIGELRKRRFATAVSARPDPRDHLLMAAAGVKLRVGFPRAGSSLLLTERLSPPLRPHRAAHWEKFATHFGWALPRIENQKSKTGNHIVIHTGAGHPVREWPRERYEEIATRLRSAGWSVTVLDDSLRDIDRLLDILVTADRFIGNDSGPGHLAALLGVPTFTIFGPQLPELFAPQHPQAAWIEGAPCPYKPCFDRCRFPQPNCLVAHSRETVWAALQSFLPTKAL